MKARHFIAGLVVAVIANVIAMVIYDGFRKKRDAVQRES